MTSNKNNIAREYFQLLTLFDDFNEKAGYEFMFEPGRVQDVVDCVFNVFNNYDILFDDEVLKEGFIKAVVDEAYGIYQVRRSENKNFNLSDEEEKMDFISDLEYFCDTQKKIYGNKFFDKLEDQIDAMDDEEKEDYIFRCISAIRKAKQGEGSDEFYF